MNFDKKEENNYIECIVEGNDFQKEEENNIKDDENKSKKEQIGS